MFNFKKIGKKVLSSVLGVTLAMGSFLNTQIVKAGELDREKYWDPYTMLSNAEFILGGEKKNEIENLKKELETTGKVKDEAEFEKNLGNLLNQNESAKNIYDAVKKCITDEEADFEKLSSVDELSTIKEVKNSGDDLQYKIARFGKKVIVFIVLPKDGTLTKEHMKNIDKVIKDENIFEFDFSDFSKKKGNINVIIRSQQRNDKFKIGKFAIYGCKYAIINAQGALLKTNRRNRITIWK